MTGDHMLDAINKVGDAMIDLDSGRFALAFLMETTRPEDHSADTIQCVMNTLAEAAQNLKAGFDVLHVALREPGPPGQDSSLVTMQDIEMMVRAEHGHPREGNVIWGPWGYLSGEAGDFPAPHG